MAKGAKLKLVKWHLGEEELARLEELKEKTGISMAEHTRRAINLYYEAQKGEKQPARPKAGPLPVADAALERSGNVLVCGASRSGKTWAMKPWIARSVREKECVVVLDTCIGKELLECALQAAWEAGRGDDLFFFDTVPDMVTAEACFAPDANPVALFHFENTFILQTPDFPRTLRYVLDDLLATLTRFSAGRRIHLFVDEAHRLLYPEFVRFLAAGREAGIAVYLTLRAIEQGVENLSPGEEQAFLSSFDTRYFFRPGSPRSLEVALDALQSAGAPADVAASLTSLTSLRQRHYWGVTGGSAVHGRVPEMKRSYLSMEGTLLRGSRNAYPVSLVTLPKACIELREELEKLL